MDPGSSSNATTSSLSGSRQTAGWRSEGVQGHEADSNDDDGDEVHLHPHPLRTSLSTSDAGSLSLHARLQSTPRGKAARGALHRVYRTARPVTTSSSATESSEAGSLTNSSVSLSSADEDEEEEVQGLINKHDSYNNSSSRRRSESLVRDYWRRIIVDIQDSDAIAETPQMARPSSRQQYLAAQAPSTGSSTLVEQEAEAYQNKAEAVRRPASSGREVVPLHPSRTPPGQTSSRFASAVTYAEQEHEEYDRSVSSSSAAERSTTPQQHSYQQNAQSSLLGPNESRVASRVHDIFQRHIHNASTSYSSRRLSGNTTLRKSVKTSRPRQRLRDLLSSSEVDLGHSDAGRRESLPGAPAPQPSHQDALRSDLTSAYLARSNRTSPQYRSSLSMSGEHRYAGLSEASHESGQTKASRELSHGDALLSLDESKLHTQSPHERTSYEPQQKGSLRQPHDVLNRLSSDAEDDIENDGDVEDHQDKTEPETLPNTADRLYAVPLQSQWRSPRLQEDVESTEEGGSLPSPPDMLSDEDEQEGISDPRKQQGPLSSRSQATASTPAKQPYQIMDNARLTDHGSSTPSRKSAPASPSPRRSIRQSYGLFRTDVHTKTPPKTPRFPGHYLATTPLQLDPPSESAPHSFRKNNTTPSRPTEYLHDTTTATPFIPGRYTSPFPHSKSKLHAETSKMNPNASPARVADITIDPRAKIGQRSRDRFSSMLHRVIEEANADSDTDMPSHAVSSPPKVQATVERSYTLDSMSMSSNTPAGLLMSGASGTAVNPHQDQGNTSTSTLVAAESSLQGLLGDIVKPLKGLLGGLTMPEAPKEASVTASHSYNHHAATLPEKASAEQSLPDRRKRGIVQDDTLRRLQEADLLDQSLASKAEELRHALEDMSNKFTTQVSTVLNETFARENRKRKLWFAFLIFAEFALLWTLWSFANARANLIYQTTYYDPFSPALYATPPQSHISDLYYSNSLASIPTSTTPHHQTTSWNLFNTLASYFRVSINPFSGFLPLDPSISGYHTSLGPRSDALSRHGLASCIYHFISVFRHMYDQLLNIGLGTSSFAHGTLGGGVVNSGSGAWSNSGSQLYRVPT